MSYAFKDLVVDVREIAQKGGKDRAEAQQLDTCIKKALKNATFLNTCESYDANKEFQILYKGSRLWVHHHYLRDEAWFSPADSRPRADPLEHLRDDPKPVCAAAFPKGGRRKQGRPRSFGAGWGVLYREGRDRCLLSGGHPPGRERLFGAVGEHYHTGEGPAGDRT